MKRLSLAAILAVSVAVGYGVIAQDAPKPDPAKPAQEVPAKATIDKPVKNFRLVNLSHEAKDTDKPNANMVGFGKFKDKKNVVVFFMSEKCSVTWKYEKRFGDLVKKYKDKDVAILGVRCSANDTPEGLKKWADSRNFSVPLLNDEKGMMTTYFEVRSTPTFAVLDKKGVLRYWGSFDNSPNEGEVTKHYVVSAVDAVLEGKTVEVTKTRPFG